VRRILVTGASGQIGREVVAQRGAAGQPVRAMSATRRGGFPTAVEVGACDLSQPETLDDALKDVEAVFLVWVVPLASASRAIERIASRAERIVYLSAPIRTNHPFFQQPNPRRQVNEGVERLIEASGMRWTMLRPGPFALNCRNWWAPQTRKGDVVRWFHAAAQTAPVHERDIAAVAVRALSEERHDGRDYVLTGPASLMQREQLAVIGDAIGRTLRFDEVSPEMARREVVAAWPAWVADMLLSAYGAAVDRPALVTSAIEEVTGTPARTFHHSASDHAADFATKATFG
jgi:uncharacterized protein YbjT (DUF2867 family)